MVISVPDNCRDSQYLYFSEKSENSYFTLNVTRSAWTTPYPFAGEVPQSLFPHRTILSPAMAVFECDRCGKCCVSLGPLLMIERQLNDRDYYCSSAVDSAIFLAHVDPAFREEIADEFAAGDLDRNSMDKKSCAFLRKNPDGDGTACAIYTSRPAVCRDFRCYRMLIRNNEGAICGRVIGKNTLRTEDAVLKKVWDEEVSVIPHGDAVARIKNIAGILDRHGYCADPVE
jgi:hypothetical protein